MKRKHILTDEQISHTRDWLREQYNIALNSNSSVDIVYYEGAVKALSKMGFSVFDNCEIVINDGDEEE